MAVRLGRVIYWAACILAAGAAGIGISMALTKGAYNPAGLVGFGIIIGGIVWAIGRAARYVLAGE